MSAPACSQCGVPLAPGQAACPSCGKLVAAPAKGNAAATVLLGCAGIAVGLVAGAVVGLLVASGVMGFAQQIAGPGYQHPDATRSLTHAFGFAGAALELGLCALAFWFGIVCARRGHPEIGVFLMATAVSALLPMTICTFAAFGA